MAQQYNRPSVLQGIMNMPYPTQVTPAGSGLAGAMGSGGGLPQIQMDGQVGPGGMPVPGTQGPGGLQPMSAGATGAPAKPTDSNVMEMQIQEFMNTRPQEVAQVQEAVSMAMQSGELTPQELNTAAQLATAALRNPAMYSQIRAFAIQQGLATEQDISPEYDEGLIFGLIVAARAGQNAPTGQNAMAPAQAPMAPGMQAPMPSMGMGGQVPNSTSPTGEVPIMAHEKEMVIPKWLVEEKGTAFFKSMISKGPMSDKA